FCHRRKPRLLFDGAVAIPSAYLPPNYAEVEGAGTLRSSYNYDTYLTTGSRTSDFKFITSYNDSTLAAGGTLKKSPDDSNMINLSDAGESLEILIFNTVYDRKTIHISLHSSRIRSFIMEYPGCFAWCFLFGITSILLSLPTSKGDISYSSPEERKIGSVIGNLAKDLGLNAKTLALRKARLDVEGDSKRYCDIDINTGDLTVADRIDREQLCGFTAVCMLKYEVILENPLELHRVAVEITDINDNAPVFTKDVVKLEIREQAHKGARYAINEAHDADIGVNAVQTYKLQDNPYFSFVFHNNPDQEKYGEIILEKELDREQEHEVRLLLTALDGGNPPKSASVLIHVTVLDANDNSPVFSQPVYKVSLREDSPVGTTITTVTATDADEGANGQVIYEFGHISNDMLKLFRLESETGNLVLIGAVDYERQTTYEIRIQ
ncbi:uncharacterized protein LOC113650345, partial [Tachysurus ichikawai]